jgi:hypothetical protein
MYFDKKCKINASRDGICGIMKIISLVQNQLSELQGAKENISKTNVKSKKISTKEDAEENIKRYINYCGYDYEPKDILNGYKKLLNQEYVSFTMKDCIKNNEEELKFLTEKSL